MTIERRPGAEPAPEELATADPHRPSLWRQGDFMKLWTGQTISQFGDEITLLGVPLLAILILGAEALEIGILGVVRFLPWILFTLPAGVWVDRMRRRPILIGADVARAVLLASIPIAFVGGWLSMIQVYVVAFLAGTFEVFFDVAYQSYLPSRRRARRAGRGQLEARALARRLAVAGPTVAGLPHPGHQRAVRDRLRRAELPRCRALHRPHPAQVRPDRSPHDPAEGKRPSMWQEARAGVGYVVSNRYLRSIAACTGTLNLFGNIGGAVLHPLPRRDEELGLTPATIGLIFALGNIGVLLGALTRWAAGQGDRHRADDHCLARRSRGVAAFAVPLAPPDDPFWVLVIGGVFVGFGVVVYNVNQVGLRQAITPDRMLGRMNATMRLIVWGTIPIGALIGGILGTVFGLQPALWVAAIGDVPRLPAGPLLAGAEPSRDPGPGRMTLSAPMRCSALAEELGEPMAGTVDQRRRWLLLEDRSAWGDRCRRGALRRRCGRDREAPAACGCYSSGAARVIRPTTRCAARSSSTPRPRRWPCGPSAARRPRVEAAGRRCRSMSSAPHLTDPILLVCTNGRRDACCALRGRALTLALADEHAERTWECTHLGGHRFAANLVCLPHGIVYGRVPPDDGRRLAGLPRRAARSRAPARPLGVAGTGPGRGDRAATAARARRASTTCELVAARGRGPRHRDLSRPDGRTHRLELRAERVEPPRADRAAAPTRSRQPLHWSRRRAVTDADLLVEAAERFGTPLYVTDLDGAAGRARAWRDALPGALVAYAVKANPDPALLRRLAAEEFGFEVVGPVELALATARRRRRGRIVVNGVGQTDARPRGRAAQRRARQRRIARRARGAAARRAAGGSGSASTRASPPTPIRTSPPARRTRSSASRSTSWPRARRALDASGRTSSRSARTSAPTSATSRRSRLAELLRGLAPRTLASSASTSVAASPGRPRSWATAVRPHLPDPAAPDRRARAQRRGRSRLAPHAGRPRPGPRPPRRRRGHDRAHPADPLWRPPSGIGAAPGPRRRRIGPGRCRVRCARRETSWPRTSLGPDVGRGSLLAIGEVGAYGLAMASGYNGRLLSGAGRDRVGAGSAQPAPPDARGRHRARRLRPISPRPRLAGIRGRP